MANWSWDTWLALLSLVSFLVLAYSSAWLRGLGWFVATVFSMAVFIAVLCGGALVRESGLRLWVGGLGALVLFGFFFYWISARYVTQTRLLDLTYHSRDALMSYITERKMQTSLAGLLRVLGPGLLAAVALLTVLAVAIKFKLTGDL
jgi:hypothetical protein